MCMFFLLLKIVYDSKVRPILLQGDPFASFENICGEAMHAGIGD